MVTKLSRKRRALDNKLTQLLWEHSDSYTLTPTDIANGWFEHTLIHPRIVYKLLVRCRVNAGEYPFSSMIVNEDTGLVRVTLGGWETVDEDVKFQYYYRFGGRLVPAEPVTPTWTVAQAITSYYDADAVYHSPGPLTGTAISDSAGLAASWGSHGRYDFDWTLPIDFASFASQGIVGMKFVGEFDGNGEIAFDINADNPNWPGAPEWPDDNGYSHLTLNPSANFIVSGPTTQEWTLKLPPTAGDDLYQGLSYNTPLQDFEVSLHKSAPYNHCYGTIQGAAAGVVTIKRFDMVLIGTPT